MKTKRLFLLILLLCSTVGFNLKAQQYTGFPRPSTPVQWCGYYKGSLIGVSDIIADNQSFIVSFSMAFSEAPNYLIRVYVTNGQPGWRRIVLGTLDIYPNQLQGDQILSSFSFGFRNAGTYSNGTVPYGFEIWDMNGQYCITDVGFGL